MKKYLTILFRFTFFILLFYCSIFKNNNLIGQTTTITQNDVAIAKTHFEQKKYVQCISVCLFAIDLLDEKEKNSLEKRAEFLFLLAKSYQLKEHPEPYLSLKYFLECLKIYSDNQNLTKIQEISFYLAKLYEELTLAEQEKQQLDNEKLLLKIEKTQNEKKLRLHNLESKHFKQIQKSQMLQLEQERLINEQNLQVLEKEQQIQLLQLQQKTLEQNEQKKQIQQLKKERAFQEKIIEDEENIQKYMLSSVILCIAVMMIMGIAFLNKQRFSKELEKRHQEIEYKRIELDNSNLALLNSQDILQQKMTELEVQQRIIKTQKIILERSNSELKQKDDRFTHSLRYAQRIQQTILPLNTQFLTYFDDFFVIFKPKDVVSGDFYWFTSIQKKHIVAIVDCTGHGVPGAFMSMIGNTLLKQIVNEQKITSPAAIINALHYNICQSLNQESSNSNDGMDIGICSIEQIENSNEFLVQFSGAKNNLFYLHENEIHILTGQRLSIGGKSHLKNDTTNFSTHTIKLNKGDILYFLTDGIIDAANQSRKRFGSRNVKKVLMENHHLKMEEQEYLLNKALTEHQFDTEQRDDITVLGIKL